MLSQIHGIRGHGEVQHLPVRALSLSLSRAFVFTRKPHLEGVYVQS